MFARKAARTFALTLGLVALLASAASAPAAEEPAAPAKKNVVNLNQASADELARLPRVGPSLAGKIVAHREQHGPFKRAQDLMEVKGIGEKMFAILQPYLAVSGPTTLAEKVSSKGTGARKATKPAKGKPAAGEKAGRWGAARAGVRPRPAPVFETPRGFEVLPCRAPAAPSAGSPSPRS